MSRRRGVTPRPIPPAPPWYRLEVPEGLDGFDRFIYGPAPKMPAIVLALAYRIGVMPGTPIRATRSSWQLPIKRGAGPYSEPRAAYLINVPFGVDDMGPAGVAHLEQLAAAALAQAGEPARVRELLEHAEYLRGRASVIDARGRCYAIHRGAAVVAIVPRVPGGAVDLAALTTPHDLDELAEIVPLVEPASVRAERWRERGDDS